MEQAEGNGAGSAADLAALLRAHRLAAGLSQRELSTAAGMSVAAVRDLEQGRRRRPRPGSVSRLAVALGLDASQADELAVAARGEAHTATGASWRAGHRVAPAHGLWLQVLGPLEIWRDGVQAAVATPGQRATLALLALSPGALVHRETIIDALWAESPPVSAVNMVQAYLSRLRKALDPDCRARDRGGLIMSTGTSYRLQVTADELDLLAFGEWVERARAACRSGQQAAACAAYEEALALWKGEPLADVDLLRRHVAVAELARQQGAAVVEYADVASAAGSPGSQQHALAQLRALVQREPLNEHAHARLMIALASSGYQAVALQVFEELRSRLDDQLGVYPGAVVTEAHARVLRQDLPQDANDSLTARSMERPAAVPKVPAPRQLPPRVPHFAGRATELKMLSGLLSELSGAAGTVVISAINGTAGIGKTALAVRFAHQVADEFPDGQLYVNLRGFDPSASPVTPAEAVRGFLDALQIPVERIPNGLEAQAALYRSLAADRRLLIVLDNARDAAQVRPLLPGSPACLVLVTSRSQLTGLVVTDGARPLTLDVLTETESGELLRRRLGPERMHAEPAAAADLIRMCAGLPLALSVAAARAATRPNYPLASLADELRDARRTLDALETGDPAADVRAVFSLSYLDLTDAAARMFRLLGIHPGPDISGPAAASLAAVSLEAAREALTELANENLLAEHLPGRFAFHDLLRAYATEQAYAIDSAADRRAAIRRVLDHCLHTANAAGLLLHPGQDPLALSPPETGVLAGDVRDYSQALAWCHAEHRVLMRAVSQAAARGFNAHAWQISWCLAPFLDLQGQWNDWAALQSTALAAATRQGDQTGQARASHSLGRAYARLGSYDESHAHLSRASELYGRLGDHAGQARTHLAIGRAAEAREHHGEALAHAVNALRLYRKVGNTAGQATALNAVGWCQAQLGDHHAALGSCEQAIELHRARGDRHGEAETSDSIGSIHHRLGRYDEAVARYQYANELCRALGDRHSQAVTLTHLGDTYLAAGRPEVAREVWQEALITLDYLHHPDAEKIRGKLARLGHGPAHREPARGG